MTMIIDVLSLFLEMFFPIEHSIIKRARDRGIVNINIHNIRDFSKDKHKRVDDYPYGGGSGMVMMADPIYNAVDYIRSAAENKPFILLMGPGGKVFNQTMAKELSVKEHLLFICGHYEGIDDRIRPLVDEEVSIGDYVLTGGELASMVIIDSVCRLIPGVLSSSSSYEDESFYSGFLEYPQYTRPEVYNGMKVPDVLLSGHHEKIRKWRRLQSLKRTLLQRPDMIEYEKLSVEDKVLIDKINFGEEDI